ncbi:MAG: hypothetical protein ACRDU9_01510 [Acidimicrobiia bacterium]
MLRHVGTVPISEAARADLYNGLAEVLGPERAETLMTHLPRFDPADVAKKSDLAELRTELRDGLAAVNQRLDRLFLALLVGTFGLVTAMVGVIFTVG